jgi:hypothetical protein
MSWININAFMDRFHAIERELRLFESSVDGELWWDSVRFDVCYYLYGCLTGLTYSSGHFTPPRRLGILRRRLLREWLMIRARLLRREVLAIRAARNVVEGRPRDVVFDPLAGLLPASALTINTMPRRYHLPDHDPARWPGTVPQSLPDLIHALLDAFGIDHARAARLDELIRRVRGEYASQLAGYRRLFAAARPKAVLMVQNGMEKALFHAARERGVPVAEVQHGLIGHGHPAYSYQRGIEVGDAIDLPDLFLTFSEFWQSNGHYPVARQEVVGTDHFAAGFTSVTQPFGAIMVIAANIYHQELFALTREVAARLPNRKFIYKLHPNQKQDEAAIRAAFSDLANVEVGDPLVPASRLMAEVSHLVAIQSTVVYEALQNGRRINILPRHDYQIHADIFGLASVSVPETTDALVAALELPSDGGEGVTFFEKFSPQRAREVLVAFVENARKAARR